MQKVSVQQLIQLSSYAIQAQLFQDSFQFLKDSIIPNLHQPQPPLHTLRTQFSQLTTTSKSLASKKCSQLRFLDSQTRTDRVQGYHRHNVIKMLRHKVQKQLITYCEESIGFVKKYFIEFMDKPEDQVKFYKFVGDMYRKIGEYMSDGGGNNNQKGYAKKASKQAYQKAQQIVNKCYSPANPIKLGLALSHAVFQYQINGNLQQAITIARRAYNGATQALEALQQHQYRDSSLILVLLRDNLTLWQSQIQDQE